MPRNQPLTSGQRQSFIFRKRSHNRGSRFSWLEKSLLGDIQTYLDGIEAYLEGERKGTRSIPRGAGNLSLPILLGTTLELASAFYCGKTKALLGNGYDATANVERFFKAFFPHHYQKFPRLLWDGIRNGLTHSFRPKAFSYQGQGIAFGFYVERSNRRAWIEKGSTTARFRINCFELAKVTKGAVSAYKRRLRSSPQLQKHFIDAWSSIANSTRNIDNAGPLTKEASLLFSRLRKKGDALMLHRGKIRLKRVGRKKTKW